MEYHLQLEQGEVIGLIIAAIIVVVSFFASYRSQSRRRLIEALPTSATQGVFIGLVEIKGTAESAAPLRTFLAEIHAVFYRWSSLSPSISICR